MEITEERNGSTLVLKLKGRFDANAALKLGDSMKSKIKGVAELVFDFAEVPFMGSAGIRVILQTQKWMNEQGKMILRSVSPQIRSLLEVSQLIHFFTLE